MSIIIFIIVLSILIVVHEFGHFIMAKRCGVKVEVFSLGFGPKIIGKRRGGTEYRISAVPLGGYVKMAGEGPADNPTGAKWEFLSRPVGERFKIVMSGPFLNYVLGFVIFTLVFMIGIPVPGKTNRIGSLVNNYPAAKHGIKPGDAIIAVDGKKTESWEELVKAIHERTERAINLKVVRDKRTFEVVLTPRVERRFIFDGKKIALIGIKPEYGIEKYGFLESIRMAGWKLMKLTTLTFKAIAWMVTARLSLREMTGPVGIFVMTGEMAGLGFVYLLDFMGLISVSLAIFNILPIPVLDGGHLVFFIAEKIRRKPLSLKVQEKATQVGALILIMLMIFVFYSDFVKFGILDKVLGVFGR